MECQRTMAPLRLPLCPTCGCENAPAGHGSTCSQCPAGDPFFRAARAATAYLGVARKIVEKLKYGLREEYAPFMAARMESAVRAEFAGTPFCAIVPVPLHSVRRRERGFNQSLLLARDLGRRLCLPVADGLLKRTRATESQTRLNRNERADNIRNAFAVRTPEEAHGRMFLIVDDVYTTGATLNECARMLAGAGASGICCISFCRASLDSVP